MHPKRFSYFLGALLLLTGLALPAAAAETSCDSVYCFASEDFSADETLCGICVTALPDAETGTVFLGTRIIRPGDILTTEQLCQMTFRPLLSETSQEAIVTYLPIYPDRVESTTVMSIAVLGKTDQAPIAEDSSMETYKNLPNEAMLKVKDPEGGALTFTITRQPKRGDVVIREDGSFHYTPKKNKVGIDSFTYTATDPAGNVSREATVTITILKPEDARQYADTTGNSCRFAAEWMKNTGIFVSESIGGNNCFRPEKQVSRGEFLTMLVGALDIPMEEDFVYTGLDDQTPAWLRPYLTAALRSGLTTGLPSAETFDVDGFITGAEAAVMVHNALDLSRIDEAASDESIDAEPAWAYDACTVLAQYGISVDADATLTRGSAAQLLYQASLLSASAPGTSMLQTIA